MNIPNTITFSRVVVAFAAAFFLCMSFPFSATIALVLFILAAASDWVDGYIARKNNIVTNLGKFMDALCDKVMVIGLFMTLLGLGLYGRGMWTVFAIFCTFASVTREFFVSGIRMLAANANIVLAAETLGKYKAAFQMYSIGAIIFAHAMVMDFPPAMSILRDIAFYSGHATLAISTILSLVSGFGYFTKYGYLLKE